MEDGKMIPEDPRVWAEAADHYALGELVRGEGNIHGSSFPDGWGPELRELGGTCNVSIGEGGWYRGTHNGYEYTAFAAWDCANQADCIQYRQGRDRWTDEVTDKMIEDSGIEMYDPSDPWN